MNLSDQQQAFKKRESYGKFTEKFADRAAALDKSLPEFNAAITAALKIDDNHAKAIDSLARPFKQTQAELLKVAKLEKNGWVKVSGTDEEYKTAFDAYEKATNSFENFLAGKEKVKLADGSEVGVTEALKASRETAQKAVDKANKVFKSPLGMLRFEGFAETVKHNMNFLDKTASKGRTLEFAGRYGAVVAGAGLTIDSFRGKTKDDEPRSVVKRIIEGGVGLAAIAGGMVVAQAR